MSIGFINNFLYFLTASSVSIGEIVITGGADSESAGAAVQGVSEAVTSASGGGFGGFGIGGMVLYIVGLIALFYFFAIRPQKKREKELKTMQSSIIVGDWVMTTSGFYGKVVDVSDSVFVIEFGTNKSISIPVNKNEILGKKEPDFTKSSTSNNK